MRLTERTRKLIPETGYRKERSVIRNEDDVGGRDEHGPSFGGPCF